MAEAEAEGFASAAEAAASGAEAAAAAEAGAAGSGILATAGEAALGVAGEPAPGVVHRQKRPEDRNATAVVDRTIQTLKKDLAGEVARQGGKWDDHVADATEAYNAGPRGRARRARGRGDAARHPVQGAPGQRREVPAQQAAHGGAPGAPAAGRRLPRAHQRQPQLPAQLRPGQRPGGLRLDDRQGHGRQRDAAEACAAGAQKQRGAQGSPDAAAHARARAAAAGLQRRPSSPLGACRQAAAALGIAAWAHGVAEQFERKDGCATEPTCHCCCGIAIGGARGPAAGLLVRAVEA